MMESKPIKLGTLTVRPPVFLAPMAGYTHWPFRVLCRRMGCGMVFTELTTVEGIRRRQRKTMIFLESVPEERPVAAHVYGADPESFAAAAGVIESLGRFPVIDINCGCPVPKVMRKGAGAALMREPEKVRQIVEAVVGNTSLPVMVKTRLGLQRGRLDVFEVADAVQQGGASGLTVHARFADDGHSGPADWDALRRVKEACAIPVIGNGGIEEARDAAAMMAQTGVDGVMVARAAIGNPWIFRQIAAVWAGEDVASLSAGERLAVIEEHVRGLHRLTQVEERGVKRKRMTAEQVTCQRFRGHLAKYLQGTPGLRGLQRRLMDLESIEEVLTAVVEVLEAGSQSRQEV
jgi:tRNA-dihydrouridine synthase B